MNRLTLRLPDYFVADLKPGYGWSEIAERLAAYEDTELEPEQCAKYAQAEKEGRLLVLPCKVGALTYTPDLFYDPEEDGDPIQRFVVEGEDTYFETRHYLQRPISELGKTVFFRPRGGGEGAGGDEQ